MWPDLADTALRLGEESVSYGELLIVGAATGRLDEARSTTRAALAALSADGGPSRERLRAEAISFRSARRLQSAEDLHTWLGARGVSTAQWEEHLRRSAVAPATRDEPSALAPDALAEALVVDLACGGWWGSVAEEAKRHFAASCWLDEHNGEAAPEDRSGDVDDEPLEHAAARLSRSLPALGVLETSWCAKRLSRLRARQGALRLAERHFASEALVSRRVADHAADWVHFDYDEVSLPSRAAANEAMLCAREDGLSPDQIAARSGRPLEHHELRRDAVPTAVAALLSGAAPAEALGPVDSDRGVEVLWLNERQLPSPSDPVVRAEAASELLAEALERAVAGRVQAVGVL